MTEVFIEQDYLKLYPDVAWAVRQGDMLSGRQHYSRFGKAEGRRPFRFDAEWYGREYPEAREAVASGAVPSLLRHFETVGHRNGFAPHPPGTPATDIIPLPLAPVALVFVPRSGSTMLMDILTRHPEIVIANHYPYEVRVATYYAQAHHHLSSPGDHQRSGTPSEFMRDFDRLSLNPFCHPEFADLFSRTSTQQRFYAWAADKSRRFSQDAARGFYTALAQDQNKSGARFFVEKSELNARFRFVLRDTFPDLREIVLIRDLRDLYCSYRRYFTLSDPEQASGLVAHAARLLLSLRESDDNVLFIRYEDLLHRPQQALDSLSTFLQIAPIRSEPTDGARQTLFSRHATSATPEASVERWRHDLGEERTVLYDELGPTLQAFNQAFGYRD